MVAETHECHRADDRRDCARAGATAGDGCPQRCRTASDQRPLVKLREADAVLQEPAPSQTDLVGGGCDGLDLLDLLDLLGRAGLRSAVRLSGERHAAQHDCYDRGKEDLRVEPHC